MRNTKYPHTLASWAFPQFVLKYLGGVSNIKFEKTDPTTYRVEGLSVPPITVEGDCVLSARNKINKEVRLRLDMKRTFTCSWCRADLTLKKLVCYRLRCKHIKR